MHIATLSPAMLECLVEKDGDVNRVFNGDTVMDLAARLGKEESIKVLLREYLETGNEAIYKLA